MGNGTAIMSTGGFLAVVAVLFAVRSAPQPRVPDQQAPAATPGASGPPQSGRQLLEAQTGTRIPVGGPFCDTTCELDILIATLPDPFDSALDWGFDAYLESIRRAYEAAGFITDRFYLPGRTDTIVLPTSTPADSNAAADSVKRLAREVKPGVLLFRSVDPNDQRLKLLYVVYEIPTSGIHREAMETALSERRALLGAWAHEGSARNDSARTSIVRVLGPTFSGSARSLAAVLEREHGKIEIVSGTATDLGNVQTFQRISARGPDPTAFQATVHPDSTLFHVLGTHVLGPLDICPEHVAVLRETTSQYAVAASSPTIPSQKTCPDGGRVLDIAFPMNIASLRAEYARNPEAQSSTGLPPLSSRESRVPLSLQDPARRQDTPPSYSGLTPAALEQSLAEIVRTLRAREARLVVLVGTDIRDKMFLGRELKKQLRDVCLVTFESNALYLHDRHARDLRGMLVLSTYPLILENQRWSADRSSFIAFGSEGAVGIFNAASMLLGNDSAVVEYGGTVEGESPASGQHTPRVWITAIGRESLLPIRAVDAGDSDRYVRTTTFVLKQGGVDFRSMSFLLLFVILGASLLTIGVARTQYGAVAGELASAGRIVTQERDGKAAVARARASKGGSDVSAPTVRERIESEFDLRRQRTSILEGHVPGHDLVEDGSLLIHARLYALWMLIGSAGITFPLLGLAGGAMAGIMSSGEVYSPERLNLVAGALVLITAVVAVGCWVAAMLRGTGSLVRLVRVFGPIGLEFAGWDRKRSWKFNARWWGEIVLRGSVAVAAVIYLALVLFYAGAAFIDGVAPDLVFTLYFHRAMQFDGGLSPILTLALVGTGALAWGAWHARRIRRLLERTPFEQALEAACSRGGERAGPARTRKVKPAAVEVEPVPPARFDDRVVSASLHIPVFVPTHGRAAEAEGAGVQSMRAAVFSLTTVVQAGGVVDDRTPGASVGSVAIEEPECDGTDLRHLPLRHGGSDGDNDIPPAESELPDGVVARTVEALALGAHEIRQRLFYVVPPGGWILLAALGLMFVWLVAQLGGTLETIAAQGGRAALVFELVYESGLVAAIAVTAWCTYRLRAVWEAVMGMLADIADTPLLPAFGRLPVRLANATRFRLLPGKSEPSVPAVARQQWQYLARIHTQADGRALLDENLSAEQRIRLGDLMTRKLTWRHDLKRATEAERYAAAERDEAYALCALGDIVAELWSRQPTEQQIREEVARIARPARRESDRMEAGKNAASNDDKGGGKGSEPASSTDRLRRRYTGPAGLWLEVAEEFLASGVAEYIQTIQAQMRDLGWFLLVATLLGTALLSSYPFEPQALFKVLFLTVLLITVGSLIVLVTEMNRNEVLSQIDHTTPGVVTWNTTFVLSLVFYGAVPLIAVLSSQYATVRDALFAWVEPLMHTIGKF